MNNSRASEIYNRFSLIIEAKLLTSKQLLIKAKSLFNYREYSLSIVNSGSNSISFKKLSNLDFFYKEF